MKKQMTTGGYHFIKRNIAYYPPTQRAKADPTTVTPASCLVELNVNTMTGEVEIMRHHMIMNSGTMIVPELVSGQIQGGTAMGIGHALMEELPLYEDGPVMEHGILTAMFCLELKMSPYGSKPLITYRPFLRPHHQKVWLNLE
ncbi:molybdopterin cofactor-binding domain-containing protein [Providencia huaxiensis]